MGNQCSNIIDRQDNFPRVMGNQSSKIIDIKDNFLKRNSTKVDWISDLPDDILYSILSLLTMKDALKTSVLSRRWRFLVASRSHLNFDISTMLDGMPARWVLDTVTLNIYEGPKIISFRISSPFSLKFDCHVDQWIKFIVKMGVEKLNLCFSPRVGDFDYQFPVRSRYMFPCQLLPRGKISVLKHLHLETCILRPPPDFDGFNSLITLYLEDVRLFEGDVENLFSCCLILEEFRVKYCSLPYNLRIVGSSLQLKYLDVYYCCNLRKIELSAANLVTFKYEGHHQLNFSSSNVPHLAKVYLFTPFNNESGKPFFFTQLAKDLPRLERLSIIVHYDKLWMLPASIATFTRLKQLNLIVNSAENSSLQWIIYILNASPLLQILHVMMYPQVYATDYFISEGKILSGCLHHQLRIVEISGFDGSPNMIKLAVYMLNNAVVLERMVLRWDFRIFWRGRLPIFYPWRKGHRDELYKLLRREVPSTSSVELVLNLCL